MTRCLIKEFKKVTCVEPSKKLLEKINNYKNLTKANCLFEDFKSNKKYSTIILDHVLEHVKSPSKFLKKIYKLLNKSGTFIVGVPNADSFHRLVAVEMGILKKEIALMIQI